MKVKLLKRLTAFTLFIIVIGIISVVQAGTRDCASITSELQIGEQAIVLPGEPNNVRSQPSRSGDYLGQIPEGAILSVIDGPKCADNVTWWYVNYRNLKGWTAEGFRDEVYLEPHTLFKVSPSPTLTRRPTRIPTISPIATQRSGTISPAMAEIAIETLFNGNAADVKDFICPSLIEEFGDQNRLFTKTHAKCKASSKGMDCAISMEGQYSSTIPIYYNFYYESGKLCL